MNLLASKVIACVYVAARWARVVRLRSDVVSLLGIVAAGSRIACTLKLLAVLVMCVPTANAQEGVWKFNIGSYTYGFYEYGVSNEAESEERLLNYVEKNFSCIRPRIVWVHDWQQANSTGSAFSRAFRLFVGVPESFGCKEILGADTNQVMAYSEAQPLQACNPAPTGLPVIPGVGAKLWRENLYSGSGSHPLNIDIHYRSIIAHAGAPSANWRHSYSARIEPAALSDRWIASRPDGTYKTFRIIAGAVPTFVSTDVGATDGLERVESSPAGVPAGAHWKLALSATEQIEYYDSSGRLLAIRERNGWATLLAYNETGQLTKITNAFGRKLALTYDSNGLLVSITDPANGVVRTAFNSAGMLERITWQDSTYRRFLYEASTTPKLMTGVVDENDYRIRSVAYNLKGQVISSEVPGTSSRTTFQYANQGTSDSTTYITDDTAAADGQPSTRSYSFTIIGGLLLSSGVSAPCPLCGSTALQTAYDIAARKTKEIGHDGTVTFYAYDAKGRETERATFASAYQSATTRPALTAATSVTSNQWHATWNLPTRTAEPGKTSSYTYDSKGNLTGQSWTATTDATGRLKFSATKTGTTYATGWSYNANSLATTIVERETPAGTTTATETGRWTLAYNALGDVTSVRDVRRNVTATMSSYDAHGRMLAGRTDAGVPINFTYSPRGFVRTKVVNGQTITFVQNAIGLTTEVRMPRNQTLTYVYDATHRLTDIKLNGASITPTMLATAEYPDTGAKATLENLKVLIRQFGEALIPPAFAQSNPPLPGRFPVPVTPGQPMPGQPEFDPARDMMAMAPMSNADRAVRRLAERIAEQCECKPEGGYDRPTYTLKTFAHLYFSGHFSQIFSNKSYFSSSEQVGQSLVDEIMASGRVLPGEGSRVEVEATLVRPSGSPVGYARLAPGVFVPSNKVRLIYERTNCSTKYRHRNEVVTMYPEP